MEGTGGGPQVPTFLEGAGVRARDAPAPPTARQGSLVAAHDPQHVVVHALQLLQLPPE